MSKWFGLFEKLGDRLIDEAKDWWKMWSSWLAIAWGVIVTAVWNSPETLQMVVNAMPEEVRALLSPLILGIVGGLPILVRLIKQQKLSGKGSSEPSSE